MKKIWLISLALVLALGSLGVGYALWSDTITVNGTAETGTLLWEFVPGSESMKADNPDWNCFYDLNGGWRVQTGGSWPIGYPANYPHPDGKNVATTNITFEAVLHPKVMFVEITNAYPYYFDHIAFEGHNYGTIPLKIWKAEFYRDSTLIGTAYTGDPYYYLDYDADGQPELELWWGNGWGTQLEYCEKHDFSWDILVLQKAQPNTTYKFLIKIYAVQWNEYKAGPITP